MKWLVRKSFDAIIVYIMISLSPNGKWQEIKTSIVDAMFRQKDANTLKVLKNSYADADIICLQESASTFKRTLQRTLGEAYHIVAPHDLDPKRDQNSLILLRKDCFPNGVSEEVTPLVLAELPSGAPAEVGDLVAVTTWDAHGRQFLVASFHGDTNGLATKPIVTAVRKVQEKQEPGCLLIFGLDANTYLHEKEGYQNVKDFLQHCKALRLRTCWPDDVDISAYRTTCHARTYLQPQLNKAIRSTEKLTKGDHEPKDHLLIDGDAFEVISCFRDNTGERIYVEDTCFPTQRFPSDHAVVSMVLRARVEFEVPKDIV